MVRGVSGTLYRDYKGYLKSLFGCRVRKITVDAGMSCPNRDGTLGFGGCVYCNARGSGTGKWKEGKSVRVQLEETMSYLKGRFGAEKFLAYFQAFSNTYAPLSKLKGLYEEALSVEDVVGLCIGTRPDCVSPSILDYLKDLSAHYYISLEYGLQSAKDKTLKLINRGHDVAAFVRALEETRKRGLEVCVHVIIGLPGETEKDILYTAQFLSKLDIQAVKIHLLYVVKGTVLETWYNEGIYTCLEQDDYVRLVSLFIATLPSLVVIQRLTGDPHREELVAPSWALDKHGNIKRIREYMLKEGLSQGCLLSCK